MLSLFRSICYFPLTHHTLPVDFLALEILNLFLRKVNLSSSSNLHLFLSHGEVHLQFHVSLLQCAKCKQSFPRYGILLPLIGYIVEDSLPFLHKALLSNFITFLFYFFVHLLRKTSHHSSSPTLQFFLALCSIIFSGMMYPVLTLLFFQPVFDSVLSSHNASIQTAFFAHSTPSLNSNFHNCIHALSTSNPLSLPLKLPTFH